MALTDKISIITGAGRGIGRGIAARFADEGATVIVAELETQLAEDTVQKIKENGGRAYFIHTDLTQYASIESMINQTVKDHGRIDVLVNNAGIAGRDGHFLELPLERWQRVMAVNLTGTFLCSQIAAREMVKQKRPGKIINIASLDSFIAEKEAVAYAASKGGVLMLTKAMAIDLARYGILVNCIAPGSIRVERNASYFDSESFKIGLSKGIPIGHPGSPMDIASAAVFFASDESSFITGASLVVDGGFSAFLRVE